MYDVVLGVVELLRYIFDKEYLIHIKYVYVSPFNLE